MNSNGPPKASNLILLKLGSSPFTVSLTKVPASTHIGSKKIGDLIGYNLLKELN